MSTNQMTRQEEREVVAFLIGEASGKRRGVEEVVRRLRQGDHDITHSAGEGVVLGRVVRWLEREYMNVSCSVMQARQESTKKRL